MKNLGRRVGLLNLAFLATTAMISNQMKAETRLKVQIGQLGHKPWTIGICPGTLYVQ